MNTDNDSAERCVDALSSATTRSTPPSTAGSGTDTIGSDEDVHYYQEEWDVLTTRNTPSPSPDDFALSGRSTQSTSSTISTNTTHDNEKPPEPSSYALSQRIQVFVRVRPLPFSDAASASSVSVAANKSMRVLHGGNGVVECTFDYVFDTNATQEDVFWKVEPTIDAALHGYNATIFAYGQTGTGKTHTMFGDEVAPDDAHVRPGHGILPRAIARILSHPTQSQPQVYMSFLQIYNDRLFDLLAEKRKQKPLLLREQPSPIDGSMQVVVPGLLSERVMTIDDALMLLRRGRANRSVRETEGNAHSSRSHAIVQFHITTEKLVVADDSKEPVPVIRKARLNIVDLAGSEKWNTDVEMEDMHSQELKTINTSLSALGNCIAALAETGRKHIPYRDSMLTRLLQDSFGGNTQATLIATVSASPKATEETIRTLQFADRAHSVLQTVYVNESSGATSSNADLMIAKHQISKLRERLESEQRRRRRDVESSQRDFLEKLQVKDKELQSLIKENQQLMRTRDEDNQRIRALEIKLQELQKMMMTMNYDKPHEQEVPEETTTRRTPPPAQRSTGSPAVKTPIKKTNLPVRTLERHPSNRIPRNTMDDKPMYKQLLEKYAVGPTASTPLKKSSFQHHKKPAPRTNAPLEPIENHHTIMRSNNQQQLMDPQDDDDQDNQPSKQLIAAPPSQPPWAPTQPQQQSYVRSNGSMPNILTINHQAATNNMMMPLIGNYGQNASSYYQTMASSHPTLTTSWSQPLLQSTPVQSTTSLTQPPVQQWQPRSKENPTSLNDNTCAKHHLRGCILCAVQDDPVQEKASTTLSFARLEEPTRQACEKHRLPDCFLCSRQSNTVQQTPPISHESTVPSYGSLERRSYATSDGSKCAAHALSNCILCANNQNRQANGWKSQSTASDSPAWHRSASTSNNFPTLSSTASNDVETKPAAQTNESMLPPVHQPSPSSYSYQASPVRRSSMPSHPSLQDKKGFNALIREASAAASFAIRHHRS